MLSRADVSRVNAFQFYCFLRDNNPNYEIPYLRANLQEQTILNTDNLVNEFAFPQILLLQQNVLLLFVIACPDNPCILKADFQIVYHWFPRIKAF